MIDYSKALYRRNNKGVPTVWYAEIVSVYTLDVYHGMVGKTIIKENVNAFPRKAEDELKTRVNAKRKTGYLQLADVADINILPVEENHILDFLQTYLPVNRQSYTGAMLPMLAKLYDNKDDKLFSKKKWYIAQPKINGLRCVISAEANTGDMFKPIKLKFQSREGVYWSSLSNLEDYLLSVIPSGLLKLMLLDDYRLDGELYIPGEYVNDINSIVKNSSNSLNKLIQFWCYDLAIESVTQSTRLEILDDYIGDFSFNALSKEQHINNTNRLVLLYSLECGSHNQAVVFRDTFIEYGFEGLILRAANEEYQFGKRNSAMWKFKKMTDGKFTIINIKPEGGKRPDIPLLTLKNDINDVTFDVHINGTFEYQNLILRSKNEVIGRTVFVEYGERSGVNQVPFHVKTVTLIE